MPVLADCCFKALKTLFIADNSVLILQSEAGLQTPVRTGSKLPVKPYLCGRL